jgi:carotenoid cleavage dioxygenase-like enzyme
MKGHLHFVGCQKRLLEPVTDPALRRAERVSRRHRLDDSIGRAGDAAKWTFDAQTFRETFHGAAQTIMTDAPGRGTQAFGAALSGLAFGNAEERDWQGGIEGRLPDWLSGTLFLNGPAAFTRGDLKRGHWIDGDGLVRRLNFGGGEADFRSRYVQTQRFVEERSGEETPCRSFGTASPGDRLRRGLTLYTPANVSAHPVGGRLLAFGEQSLPWSLDPETLETLGECTFGDSLTGITPLSAHPKMDLHGRRMCNFGAIYLGTRTRFQYYEWDLDLNARVSGQTELASGHLVHDFLISEHYASFHLSPYFLDPFAFVRNGLSLIDSMHWDPDRTGEFLVFSRASGEALAKVRTGTRGFCLHTLNAHEQDGLLVLDTLESDIPYYKWYYSAPGLFCGIPSTRLRRTLLRTTDWSLAETFVVEAGIHLDFPCIERHELGRGYRNSWMLGMPTDPPGEPKFYDRLLRFDWESREIADSYRTAPGRFLGAEPQVMMEPGRKDNGVLVCQELDVEHKRSSYLFFDAFDLGQGPISRAQLPFFDPPAFHTSLISPGADPAEDN